MAKWLLVCIGAGAVLLIVFTYVHGIIPWSVLLAVLLVACPVLVLVVLWESHRTRLAIRTAAGPQAPSGK